jgi:hypothetical protein
MTVVFVGAVPRQAVEQAIKVVDLSKITDAYVCCSGSFRTEQAITQLLPQVRVHSNDVSLLSCAIGGLMTLKPESYRFTNRLTWLNGLGMDHPHHKLASLCLAIKVGNFSGKNEYAKKHFQHHVDNREHYHEEARNKLAQYLERVKVHSFFRGDFRQHAARATGDTDMIFAWPPTYKGGYERLYKFVADNTEWDDPPSYGMFDPKDLGGWIGELKQRSQNYIVWSDQPLEDHPPAAVFEPGRSRRVYLFAGKARSSSLRRVEGKREPFRYEVADPWEFTPDSKVSFVKLTGPQMNFLKDRYLAAGLRHSDGTDRWAVFVDDKLAGGFIYTMSQMGDPSSIYLLCDFATHRDRKLSKLIAMLAACQETVRKYERARLVRVKSLFTTAFTDKPVSMKYRGIWELAGRKAGFLNYISEVRRVPSSDIYQEWFKRFARSEKRPANGLARPRDASGAPADAHRSSAPA